MRRLLPALALAQAAGILAADRGLLGTCAALALGACACALGAALARRGRDHAACVRRGRAALALVAAFAGGALALGRSLESADAARPSARIERTVEATVREVVGVGPARARVELASALAVDSGGSPVPERIRLWLASDPALPPGLESALPGERIRVRVRLAAPAARRNPGAPDAARRARRQGIGAVGGLVHPALHLRLPEREGWRPLAPLYALRARLGERLARHGRGGDLLRTLALGQGGALGPRERDACAALGVSHLLAVSGLHLGLVAALCFGAARRALARSARLCATRDVRGPALGIAFAAASAYAVLAGGGVPVRRAWVLLAALVAAAISGRPAGAANALAAAAVAILALEPSALFEAGAQLSFAGSAALALGVARARAPAPRRPRQLLADAMRVSATALLATAPIAAAHFGRSAPFALLSNAVAVPWTGLVLLPAALLAAALAALPPGAGADALVAGLAGVADASLLAAVAVGERLPAPPVAVPGAGWIAACAALALGGLWARSTAARVLAALLLGAALAAARPARVEPDPPRVVVFDVGQGDAALVQSPDAAILVDAGGSFARGAEPGRGGVVPALHALGVRRVDLLVVSHGDLDHRGGAPAVLRRVEVGELWLPLGAAGDASFAALRDAAREARVPVSERGAGSPAWARGGLVATALWPPRDARGLSRNDRSLVVRVDLADRRILLPGDLEASGERALLAAALDLRAEVLKLPHHGSRTSSTPSLLAAVGASVAVASAPCEGRFAMPHAEVVRRAREHGAALWWTGRDGAVRIGMGPRLHAVGTGEPRRCGPALQ